jgi:hypothetical protein
LDSASAAVHLSSIRLADEPSSLGHPKTLAAQGPPRREPRRTTPLNERCVTVNAIRVTGIDARPQRDREGREITIRY